MKVELTTESEKLIKAGAKRLNMSNQTLANLLIRIAHIGLSHDLIEVDGLAESHAGKQAPLVILVKFKRCDCSEVESKEFEL